MNTYTTRYQYRVKKQSSNKSNYIIGGVIVSIAILANIIVELPLYQNLIVALS